MKVLLVNLARMGDLVQTTAAAQGLEREQGAHVSLLCAGHLAGFARRLAGIHEVIPFTPPRTERRGGAASLAVHAREWKTLVHGLRMRHFDRVVNLTHDDMASRLVTMIGAREVLGRQVHEDGSVEVRGAWLRHFLVTHAHRDANSFNLADIYRRACGVRHHQGGVAMSVLPAQRAEATTLLGKRDEQRVVAIHPGANHVARRWPVERFGRLAEELADRGHRIVVLGGPDEKELADEVVRHSGKQAVSLAGRTSLEELPAVLSEVDVLATNDTGPLHIAAAVGTPTVSVFLAMARPEDTAPCGEGHLVLETLHESHPCGEHDPDPRLEGGETVTVGAVLEAVTAQLDGRKMTGEWLDSTEGHYRVLRTFWDEDGGLRLAEVAGAGERRDPSALARAYRPFWRTVLDGASVPSAPLASLFTVREKGVLLEAVELAAKLLARISGEQLTDRTDHPVSVAQLERRWLDLERIAGHVAPMLLAFRLEREALYCRGAEALGDEAEARFSRWIEAMIAILQAEVDEVAV